MLSFPSCLPRLPLAASFILAAASPSVAQTAGTIEGRITEASGKGLPGVNVGLRGTALGASTDATGAFRIGGVPAGTYTLEASFIGYQSQQLSVTVTPEGTAAPVQLALASGSSALNEVIVSASRRAETINETPVSVTVLGPREIAVQTAVTPNNIAAVVGNAVPGLGLPTNQTGNFGQTLRGRNLLVLIDGIPQSTPLRAGSRDIRTIDPAVVERIEVIKGATSIYGNGADGGLINYITRKPVVGKPFGGQTSVGVNSSLRGLDGETLGYRASQQFYGKKNAFDYVVSGTYDQSGVYKDARGQVISPEYGLGETKSYNGFLKLGYDLTAKDRVEGMYNYFSSRQSSDYMLRPGEYGQYPAIGVRGERPGTDEGTRHNHNAYLTYRGQERLPLRTSLDLTAYWQDFRTIYSVDRTFFENGGQSEINSDKRGLRLNLNTPVLTGEQFSADVTYGLDLLQDRTSQTLVDGRVWAPLMNMRNLAPYAQLRSTLFSHFVLKAGARLENIRVGVDDYTTLRTQSGTRYVGGDAVQGGTLRYNTAVYNAGLRYTRFKWLNPFVSYSEGFSLYELGRTLRTASVGGKKVTSIKELETEPVVVRNYETGLNSQLGPVNLGGVYYISRSDLGANLVQVDGILVPQRLPERVWGYELTLDYAALDNLSLGGSYAWVEGKADRGNNGQFSDPDDVYLNSTRITPPKATGYVRYSPWEQLTLNLFYVHSGRRERFKPLATPTATALYASGEGPMKPFGLLNFSAAYRPTERLNLGLGVENLLNKSYYPTISQFYGNDSNYTRGNGARLNLSASVSF